MKLKRLLHCDMLNYLNPKIPSNGLSGYVEIYECKEALYPYTVSLKIEGLSEIIDNCFTYNECIDWLHNVVDNTVRKLNKGK